MAIDRYKLVSRHNPSLSSVVPEAPLSLGNGEFAFTADITGLQTFQDDYTLVPLCTMSQWGWHSFPVDMDQSALRLAGYDTYGREVGYASDAGGQQQLFDNLRQNAHRLNLAAIGLIIGDTGKSAKLSDILYPRQTLDLWRGMLISEYNVFGEDVLVETCVDPEQDAVSAKVVSRLAAAGMLSIGIKFPYGSPQKDASDWSSPDKHMSSVISAGKNRTVIERILDSDIYYADITYSPEVSLEQTGLHSFTLNSKDNEISFTCRFTKQSEIMDPFDFYKARERTKLYWEDYWSSGGAVQLINSSNPRAFELERRLVLSQYLTAIQCSGSVPPAETGLTCNSWYGKFHLEMHYWHAAHFPLWGRPEMLEKSLGWYKEILPAARDIAANQGYTGARWPKMCDASGRNSPSWIAVFLIWQQPHPIMLAELCYRSNPCKQTLEKYRSIVIETAEFMASFAHYDVILDRYVLGPPLIPVQETHKPENSMNPAYELEYFRWGLNTANQWLLRLGEQPVEHYGEVARKLSALPVNDGVYLAHENCPETFTTEPFFHDHPSMLAALGVLPGSAVDQATMKRTLDRVLDCWDLDSLWGWDFPVMAMCCAKLGLPSLAVDMLLMDAAKNIYTVNGHNRQADREDLPLYLPGNGGLLLAVGMMAAGWDNSGTGVHAPGFPSDGTWLVESEGLNPYV